MRAFVSSSVSSNGLFLWGSRAFIAEHEDVRNKVLEELDMNGLLVTENRPRPRPVTYNDALKLSFLAATIKVRTLKGGPKPWVSRLDGICGYLIPRPT